MENIVASLKRTWRKQNLPWLALIIAIIFLVWPVPWLKSGLHVIEKRFETTLPVFGSDFGISQLVAESAHFRILAHEKYADQEEAKTFLNDAEAAYPKLAEFLGVPIGDHSITIIFLPQCEVSHGGINYLTVNTCNNELDGLLSSMFIHELTHVLMNTRNTPMTSSLLSEGLAVTTEKRFAWKDPLPFGDEIFLYESFRTGQFIPLSELKLGISYNSPTSNLQYAEAGSFSGYLIKKYGIEKFLALYESSNDYEGLYEATFEQLTAGWMQSLRVGNLVQALILMLGGTIVLGMMQSAITRSLKWIPAAITGWLAFLLWSFLLGTSNAMGLLYVIIYRPEGIPPVPGEVMAPSLPSAGLLLAATLGAILRHWKKPTGVIIFWLAGGGAMIAFLLVPAIVLFFN